MGRMIYEYDRMKPVGEREGGREREVQRINMRGVEWGNMVEGG